MVLSEDGYYEVKASSKKNRLYIVITGFWSSPEVVPNYLSDLRKAANSLKPGFTVLADLRKMSTNPSSVMPIHEEGLSITREAGVKCSAAVITMDVNKYQMNRVYRQQMIEDRNFLTMEEAEEYLDQQ